MLLLSKGVCVYVCVCVCVCVWRLRKETLREKIAKRVEVLAELITIFQRAAVDAAVVERRERERERERRLDVLAGLITIFQRAAVDAAVVER
jgi:hypothetical protein